MARKCCYADLQQQQKKARINNFPSIKYQLIFCSLFTTKTDHKQQ